LTIVKNLVKKNFFRDSLQLMRLSEEAKKFPRVLDAAVLMATDTNKEILQKLGLLTSEGEKALKDDMILAVKAEDESAADEALRKIEDMLMRAPAAAAPEAERIYYSVDSALDAMPDANFAVVSVPGEYAKDVVMDLLKRDIHVHIFSDHVPIEDEVEMKRYASERGLLVLGPGAGTSIINGKAIAFANVVRRGNVGVVAAAGTGLQEVSVLLDRVGLGVSQALGIGGNDVKKEVGGIMAIDCIRALEADRRTKLIMLVAKPPDREVMRKIAKVIAEETRKPFVICFQSVREFKSPKKLARRVKAVRGLHAAVIQAVKLLKPKAVQKAHKRISMRPRELRALVMKLAKKLKPGQKYIRALYTGGTLMYEAMLIYRELIGNVYSNAPLSSKYKLSDPHKSVKHSVIDLGEEEFTAGRPHPMIDPTIRKLRLIEEARDPSVAVILMDFMLGYGSHKDPAGAMIDSIEQAMRIAEEDGRNLIILGHVCGTRRDPQSLVEQERKLKKIGVQLFPSNALAAIASALIVRRGKIRADRLRRVYRSFVGI